MCVCSDAVVYDFEMPGLAARRAPQSVEFSRQEYWSEWPFPTPYLPDSGIQPTYPALHVDSLHLSHLF